MAKCDVFFCYYRTVNHNHVFQCHILHYFGLFELVALICLLIRRRRSQNVIFEQFEADK